MLLREEDRVCRLSSRASVVLKWSYQLFVPSNIGAEYLCGLRMSLERLFHIHVPEHLIAWEGVQVPSRIFPASPSLHAAECAPFLALINPHFRLSSCQRSSRVIFFAPSVAASPAAMLPSFAAASLPSLTKPFSASLTTPVAAPFAASLPATSRPSFTAAFPPA